MQEKPAKVRKDLERRGVVEAVRSDIARGKALAFLIEHAEVVDGDGEIVDLSLPQPTATENDGPGADEPIEATETAGATPADETAEDSNEEPKP
jgi:hypothetical protein